MVLIGRVPGEARLIDQRLNSTGVSWVTKRDFVIPVDTSTVLNTGRLVALQLLAPCSMWYVGPVPEETGVVPTLDRSEQPRGQRERPGDPSRYPKVPVRGFSCHFPCLHVDRLVAAV